MGRKVKEEESRGGRGKGREGEGRKRPLLRHDRISGSPWRPEFGYLVMFIYHI